MKYLGFEDSEQLQSFPGLFKSVESRAWEAMGEEELLCESSGVV